MTHQNQTSSDLVKQYVCSLENSLSFSRTEKLLNDLKIRGMTTVEAIVMLCEGYIAVIRSLYSKLTEGSTAVDSELYDKYTNMPKKQDLHQNCSSYDEEYQKYIRNLDNYIQDFVATDVNRLRGGGNPEQQRDCQAEDSASGTSKISEQKDMRTEVRTKIFPAQRLLNVDLLSEDLEDLEKQLKAVGNADASGTQIEKPFDILEGFDRLEHKNVTIEKEASDLATTENNTIDKIDKIKAEYWSQMESLESETKTLDREIHGLLDRFGKNRDSVLKYTNQISSIVDKETVSKYKEDLKNSSEVYDELMRQYENQISTSAGKYNIRGKEQLLSDIRELIEKDNLDPITKQKKLETFLKKFNEIEKEEGRKPDSDDDSEYDEYLDLDRELDDFYEYRDLPYDADNDPDAAKRTEAEEQL
ncbi:unnamed protein product [Hermetia illucens]|uniref:Uncharacterized protein n=1 Tax=Hermetia illucens TaxID=343691 RepID=A0A7R8UBF4_HERIL|nr:unnamed protein product [Hermetia illucens]